MILAACSGVTSKEIVLAEIDLLPFLLLVEVEHVVDGEDLDVLQDRSRDGLLDAAVRIADQMDHHVDAIAGQNQVAAAAHQIDLDGNDPVADGNHGGGALLVGPLATEPVFEDRLRRHRACCEPDGFRYLPSSRSRRRGVVSFGQCASFTFSVVKRSPMGMSAAATQMPRALAPVLASPLPLVITRVMPIDATRPQPSANNSKARDLGRIGKPLLDGLTPHDGGGR